jgi:hypothetical protein
MLGVPLPQARGLRGALKHTPDPGHPLHDPPCYVTWIYALSDRLLVEQVLAAV